MMEYNEHGETASSQRVSFSISTFKKKELSIIKQCCGFIFGKKGRIYDYTNNIKAFDFNGDGLIVLNEFILMCKKILKKNTFSDDEINSLFLQIDTDNEGKVPIETILIILRGPIDPERLFLINCAFDKLDKDQNGYIDYIEAYEFYTQHAIPDIISGKKTPKQMTKEFLSIFCSSSTRSEKVSWREFHDYYWNLSVVNDVDQRFGNNMYVYIY